MENLWQFILLIAIIIVQGLLINPKTKSTRVIFITMCFIELAFISGFRSWNIGNDTQAYINVFILSGSYPELLKSHMEVGYLIFNRFLHLFTSNPQVLLITTSIFIIGAWLKTFYKYSIALLFSVLLFVILEYSTTLTMIRQEIAIGIVLLSIPFIIRRQLFFFALMVILATSFHISAVFAIILYFLYNLSFNTKYVLIALTSTLVIFLFLVPILDIIINITGRYGSYKGNILLGEETRVASLVKTVVQFSITCFCYFSYRYIRPQTDKSCYQIKTSFLLWCSLFALCMQFISIRGTVMERLVLYYSFINFISIPFFVSYYPKRTQIFISVSMICCFILYKSIVFVYRPEWNYVLPFEFCF